MDIENTPSEGLTLDQAFTQLKASRNKAQETEELDDDNADVVEDDELDEEELDESDTDELDEEEEESDDDDQDDDSDSDQEDDGEEGEPDIWEIDVDGETVEVTTDELHKGYLRQNDYTRKRQADAKIAKDLQTEYAGKITQLNQALAQNVSQEQRQLVALGNKYKAETDESVKRNLHYQILQLQQGLSTRQAAMKQAGDLQKQTSGAQAEAYWAEQEELLKVEYENWDTKKVELKDYLTSQGFEDMSMFGHATMAKLVDKARQFDELQQKRKSVAKNKIRRKVPKVLKGGKGEKKHSVDTRKIKILEANFAKTGSIRDALALKRARG
jgi:hypothetical protein